MIGLDLEDHYKRKKVIVHNLIDIKPILWFFNNARDMQQETWKD